MRPKSLWAVPWKAGCDFPCVSGIPLED
jgi:xylose isomerase